MEERSAPDGLPQRRRQILIPRKPVAGHDLPITTQYVPFRSPIEEQPIPKQFPVHKYVAYRSPIEEEPIPEEFPVHRYVAHRSPLDGLSLHPSVYRRSSVTRRNTTRARLNGGSFSTGSFNRVSMQASISNYSDSGISPISPSSTRSQNRRPSVDDIVSMVSREISQHHATPSEPIRIPVSPLMELSAQEAAHRSSFQLQSSLGSIAASRRGTLGSFHAASKRIMGRSSSISRDVICDWLPTTLRWYFMVFIFCVSIALGAMILGLTITSQKNQGLGRDDGSAGLFFAWRFIPTILAVIYGMCTSAIVVDIKRTECFARLSRPDGASAMSSLFLKFRMTWFEPFDALTKSRNDGFRNWALFWALLINILALLVVSPFSAALLSSEKITHTKNAELTRIRVPTNHPLDLLADSTTLFRTTSSILLNISTSPWLTDDYAVLPFYPSAVGAAPSDDRIWKPSQQWTAETAVYQAGFSCIPMTIQNYANFSITRKLPSTTNISVYATLNLTSFVLSSSDGCSLGYAEFPPQFSPNGVLSSGGGWWSGGPDFTYPSGWSLDNSTTSGPNATYPFMLNTTSECAGRDILFLVTPSDKQEFQAQGHVCKSTYFSAILPVTVTSYGTSTNVTFDELAFDTKKIPIPASSFNTSNFESDFLGQNWASKLQLPGTRSVSRPNLGGPLGLLGAQNNFDIQKMMSNPELAKEAGNLKQRFFGESLLAKLSNNKEQHRGKIVGQSLLVERRIMVNFASGILLSVIFLICSLGIALVAGYTRLNERPLNLLQDPSTTIAMTSLIASGQNTRALFEGLDATSQEWMQKSLARNVFYLRHNILYSYDIRDTYQHSDVSSPSAYRDANSRSWMPRALQTWALSFFLVSLFAVLITIAVLLTQFRRTGICHGFETNHRIWYADTTFVVGPYSIISTLIAVMVRIWWSSIDETFRRLQPYVSLSQNPMAKSNGTNLSYIGIASFWAAGKAVINRHVLLTLVTSAAVLSEILIISMSGILSLNLRLVSHDVTISQSVEFRTVPAIFNVLPTFESSDQTPASVIRAVYENRLADWLYEAVIEGAYNATPSSWTSQDWAFAPFNIHDVTSHPDTKSAQNSKIAIDTASLRGRLQCAPIDMSDTTAWLDELNFQEKSAWNNTNIPRGLEYGYELNTGLSLNISVGNSSYMYWDDKHPYFSFFATDSKLQCCGNETDGTLGEAAIGYWSPAANSLHSSIIVKWVTGYAFASPFKDSNNVAHWVWRDIPKVTALNCTPVFESANATIQVDLASGTVHEFVLVDKPIADSNAWSSNFETTNTAPSAQNVSVSYGYLFHDILLGAATSASVGTDQSSTGHTENLSDATYIIRRPGLNVDFMSYTSLAMVQNNSTALLDPDILSNISSTVFSKFFQKFVQYSVPSTDGLYMEGSWGLQPKAETVKIEAKRSTAIERLDLVPVAVALSLTILGLLVFTLVAVISFNRSYLKLLPRDVDTLGSILGFVYGSERLLRQSADTNSPLSEKDAAGHLAKMGWFNGGGRRRWGIEILSIRDGSTTPLEETQQNSMEHDVRDASFDTYEAIANMALRTPPRSMSRSS